jgi:hypothetical protein
LTKDLAITLMSSPAPLLIGTSSATRADILAWVNDVYLPQGRPTTSPVLFATLSDVPGKAIAKLLNAIFGAQCPLHQIRFDDETPTAQLRNRRTVLDLARRVGFDGRLDAVKWSDGNDFANELCFWKWLFAQQQSRNFTDLAAKYDFSLVPAFQTICLPVPSQGEGERKRQRPTTDDHGDAASSAMAEHRTNRGDVCSRCGGEGTRLLSEVRQELALLEGIHQDVIRACFDQNRELLLSSLAKLS